MQETQDTIPTTSQQAGVANEQSLSQEDLVLQREKQAFTAYVKNQGGNIPENFKDVDAWFSALKSAQGEYTKSRQEVSRLKQKYEPTDNAGGFQTIAPVINTTASVSEQRVTSFPSDLKIPKQEPVVQKEVVVASAQDWKSWTLEYASNNTLSPDTISAIKAKTNMTDDVIGEYMTGQKAKLQLAYSKASEVVGGQEKMNNIFKWASTALPQVEQDNINAALATPSWEIALLGLTSKYEKANASYTKDEPSQTPTNQKFPVQSVQNPNRPYTSKREFSMERNNPRFMGDPAFRKAVEGRMLLTDFNNLSA